MRTACTLDCPDACSLEVDPGPSGLKVRGNPKHPFTQGFTCAKIQGYFQRLDSPERIRFPMLRYKGRWQEISWEDALKICTDQIEAVCGKDPAQLLHISGHGARGVSKMVVDGFFAALGCTRVTGSVCDGTGIDAFVLDFGSLEQGPLQELGRARWIINWGRDFRRSSIHTHRIVNQARQNNVRVVSIWPGGEGYEDFSDDLIRVAPGRDRFLALAVLKVLWEQDGIASESAGLTQGIQELQAVADSYSLPELAGICDVLEQDIHFLAAAYRQPPVATVIGWGVQRYGFGGENVRFIDVLAWLSGNVGMPGAGVFYNIASARNFDLSWLPDNTAGFVSLPRLGRELEGIQDLSSSMVWINGTNPVNQLPDSKRVARALRKCNFVVLMDGFWTDTARCADLVLPCTLMGEEDDLVGSCMHDYVQYARAVQSPPPGVRSDLWIARELNAGLGLDLPIPERTQCLQQSLALQTVQDQQEAWRQLTREGFLLAREHTTPFAHGPAHDDGLFHAVRAISPEPEQVPEFPFRLLSLIRKEAIHSQILEKKQDMPPTVWVNPRAAGLQGIDWGREIFVVSELGRLRVQVTFDATLHPQVLVYRRGDWMGLGGGVNQLIEAEVSDLQTGAAQYSQSVRLENAQDIG